MGSSEKEQLRETIINAEYVDFLLGLMRKYTGDVSVPELLYYEVMYTSKYLKKNGIMEEVQAIMGVWLEGIDPSILTQDKISGTEKKQLSSREMKLKEYKSRGIGYYIKQNGLRFVLIVIAMLMSVIHPETLLGDVSGIKVISTLFRVVFTLLFACLSMGIVMDFMYMTLPAVRHANGDSEKLFSSSAVDACEKQLEYVNAVSVQDRVRYILSTESYKESLNRIEPNTVEYYDKVSDIELEIHEKEVTSNGKNILQEN